MSEQHVGVEAFDPAVTLSELREHLAQTDNTIWGKRFRNAAFGNYRALKDEKPADTSYYEALVLKQAEDFTHERLLLLKKRQIAVLVFDPAKNDWFRITGVTHDTKQLSIIARVHDPQVQGGVFMPLGASTELTYKATDFTDTGEDKKGRWQYIPSLGTLSLNPVTAMPAPIGQPPFADNFSNPLNPNQI